MTTRKFSKGEAIRFGWSTLKRNFGFFSGVLIVVGLISIVPSIMSEPMKEKNIVLYFIANIAIWVLQVVIGLGLIRIPLRLCDNEKGKFADLFSCFPLFFKYLLGSILYGLIVIGGLILFIIPGIVWSIKFQFFSYFIVDKGLGPIESLKKSAKITTGAKWDLLIFGFLLGLINLLGALALLIGLFATIPITMVALAFVYRKLLDQIEIAQVPESPTKELNK